MSDIRRTYILSSKIPSKMDGNGYQMAQPTPTQVIIYPNAMSELFSWARVDSLPTTVYFETRVLSLQKRQ